MSGRVGVEQTPDIETVLAEHAKTEGFTKPGRRKGIVEWATRCICGVELPQQDHRAHVAQALAPVLAAAVREARAAELREAADVYRALDDGLPICAGHVTAELDFRADHIAVDAPEGGA